MRLGAEEFFNHFAHAGHTSHAANQNDFVDLVLGHTSIFQCLLARLKRAIDQLADQLFQIRTADRFDEVQWGGRSTFHARRDERQVHFGGLRAGQLNLGLLGSFLEALQSELVGPQVHVFLLVELVGQIFDDFVVEVFAAQEGVTIGRLHLEHAVTNLEDGDVESTAAKVINGDGLPVFLIHAIGERCRCRLVDNALNFKASDLSGVLGRLTLCIVEVCGNGDDRLGYGFAKIALGGFLHLLQDEGRNLAGRIFFAACFDPSIAVLALDDVIGNEAHVLLGGRIVERAADKSLDREQRVVRIGDGLTLCGLADKAFTILGKGDDRRRRARTF